MQAGKRERGNEKGTHVPIGAGADHVTCLDGLGDIGCLQGDAVESVCAVEGGAGLVGNGTHNIDEQGAVSVVASLCRQISKLRTSYLAGKKSHTMCHAICADSVVASLRKQINKLRTS